MRQKLSLGKKSGLLVLVGSFVTTICTYVIVIKSPDFNIIKFINNLQNIKEFFGFPVIFAIITAIFGIPVLHVIEKYFSKYRLRYIIGGIFAGYFLYSVLNSFPQAQGIWVFTDGQYHGPPVIYITPGFFTGLVFTLLVWWLESREK